MKVMTFIKVNWRTLVVAVFMAFTVYKLQMIGYSVYEAAYYLENELIDIGYEVSEIRQRLGR